MVVLTIRALRLQVPHDLQNSVTRRRVLVDDPKVKDIALTGELLAELVGDGFRLRNVLQGRHEVQQSLTHKLYLPAAEGVQVITGGHKARRLQVLSLGSRATLEKYRSQLNNT